MCGITGVLNLNGAPVPRADLMRMADAIVHRGPDGEGYYLDGPVGFGHRRLAIIDLTPAGDQPMVSQDGRFALSYNGEIYNFRQIRAELESLGYRFRSRTDSEVVLYAFAEWREQAVHKFNGMFAFAAWDKKKQELFLARDRYGIKPLYYTKQGNAFLFGSEVKAVLANPAYQIDLDKEALVEYFTFQNFFTDRTLYKDVKIVPAGHWLRVSANQTRTDPELTEYWDFDFREPGVKADEQEYVEELDRLFREAVNRQLVSDVELGTYLSGGIDSGSITAIAASRLPYIKSFTCGFDLHSASGLELGFDEREKAEHMSYLFKTEHYEMVLKAGDMERCLPKLSWHIEEPRIGQSYPNYYIAQLASKFVKVVLSGTGGDELFGGYPWRYYRAVVNSDLDHYVDKYYAYWQRLIPDGMAKEVFRPVWDEVKNLSTRGIFRDVFGRRCYQLSSPEDYVNHSLYFEAKTFLHGLLVMEDKLSMAHGVETRVPFLDNDLVDFAMRVPVHLKLGNLQEIVRLNENEPGRKAEKYFQKTRDGKLLFRKVARRYIPEKIAGGVKRGFSAPDGSWFRGESIDFVKDTLLDKQAHIYKFLDRGSVQALVNEHLQGEQNRRLLIWSLLCFDSWFAKFKCP